MKQILKDQLTTSSLESIVSLLVDPAFSVPIGGVVIFPGVTSDNNGDIFFMVLAYSYRIIF